MYPFTEGLDYVRNAWYAAGWSSEFGTELVARRYLNEPVVLYRTAAGALAVLADRCAHRAYPLSAGKREGDALVCGYHGFTYDASGRCVAIPSQPHIPAAYGVRSYPALERAGIAWIWMGDPAQADESALPDLTELGLHDPRFTWAIGGAKLVNCRYELLHENLLDLSHVGFIHAGSIGTPHVAQFPVVTKAYGNVIEASRTIYGDEATPLHDRVAGIRGSFDRTARSVFFAPGAHVTHVTMVAPGSNAAYGEPGYYGEFRNAHLVTPVSAHETYYFWTIGTTARSDDAQIAFMRTAWDGVYSQDQAALEKQEQRLAEAPDFRELSCRADEAALKARHLLAALMTAEKAAARPLRAVESTSRRG